MTSEKSEPLITTYLEMRSPDQLRPKRVTSESEPDGHLWRVTRLEDTQSGWRFNRDMYFQVGEQWRWIDKRPLSDDEWKDWAKQVRTFAAYYDGDLAGYYELRFQQEHGVEIAYFGLLPEFIGRGLGGALLTSAIEQAWHFSPTPTRVWVHTCNRDHPQALANYQARGLVIYKIDESKR